jgi:acyl carrier protein
MESPEVLAGVKQCLVSVFGVDGNTLTPNTSLASLGIESIDVLDVLFKIDTTFGISTSMRELRTHMFGAVPESEVFDENGQVTAAGLEQLQKALPGFDPQKLGPEFNQEQLLELFTVQHLVDLVDAKLAVKAAEA